MKICPFLPAQGVFADIFLKCTMLLQSLHMGSANELESCTITTGCLIKRAHWLLYHRTLRRLLVKVGQYTLFFDCSSSKWVMVAVLQNR